MAGDSRVSGIAVGSVAAGVVLAWSGIKGYSVTATLQDVITGKSPLKQPQANPVGTPQAPAAAGGSTAAGGASIGVQSSALPSAGTYDTAQLQALWRQAGGSAQAAPNAACHAIQESGGNPQVTSSNPDGGTNVGLWQLDTRGKGAGYTITELQNALNNARITVLATRNGADWSAWATPGC
jgi:Lysozyme like domain